MKKYWLGVVFFVFFFAGGLLHGEEKGNIDSSIIFYAPLDGEVTAKIAKGNFNGKPILGSDFTFTEGKKGKGLVVGDNHTSAVYEIKNNFNPQSGTLTFWVKPVNWSGYAKPHVFIRSYYDREGGFSIIIYDGGATHGGVAFYEKSQKEKKLNAIYSKGDAWFEDEWHYVAVTWSGVNVKFYVDGNLRGETQLELPMDLDAMSQFFSIGHIHSWGQEGSTTIDELYIYNRPLSPEEIKQDYQGIRLQSKKE